MVEVVEGTRSHASGGTRDGAAPFRCSICELALLVGISQV